MPDNKMTNGSFDFSHVGKRLPYTVPEGFFEHTADRLAAEVAARERAGRLRRAVGESRTVMRMRRASLALMAAAVVVLGFFLFTPDATMPHSVQTATADPVMTAFDNLSNADQQFLVELYEDDYLLNTQYSTQDETDKSF